MSIIKNVVDTTFTSKGAAGVASSTAGVTKAQTRLGQASASSGRQFSAQATGMGGLVAAYAGAAATIFALEAAYMALSKAAQAETIEKGTNSLARSIGQSGPAIIKSLREISQGQLTLAETAATANIALSAGFNASQLEKLTTIALGASRALGRDFEDALQRVTRGAAKLEPELLDELGIFTRIDPAIRAYASSLNVSASSLTQFERRQAFVNAVIEEGNKKFKSIDISASSSQKSLEQLRVQISDLGTDFLQLVASGIKPLVDFLNDNAGAALLLFGGILALVFGKSAQVISGFAATSLTSLGVLATGWAMKAESMRGNFVAVTAAAKAFNKEVASRGGVLGKGLLNAKGKPAKLAGTGSFVQGLDRTTSSAASSARADFAAGGVNYAGRKKAIADLTKAKLALTAAQRGESLAFKDATRIIAAYTVANKSATIGTRLFAGAATVATFAARGLTVAMGLLNASLGIIFTIITVAQIAGTFFDVDILKKIKEGILGIREASEDLASGFLGVAGGSIGEDLVNRVRDLGGETEGLAKRLVEMRDNNATMTIIEQGPRANEYGPDASITPLLIATTDLTKKQEKLNRVREGGNESQIRQLQIEIALYTALVSALSSVNAGFELLVGQTARLSGIPANTISDLFSSADGIIKNLGDDVEIMYNKFPKGTDFNTLTEAQQNLILDAVRLQDALNNAGEGLSDASLDSEKLSALLSGASTALKELKKNSLASARSIRELIIPMDNLNASLRELQTAEKVLAGIQKNFSSAISGVDTTAFSGLISITGKIATNTEQMTAFQNEYLASLIKAEGIGTDSAGVALTDAGVVAQKAALGLIIQNLQKTKQIRKEADKQVEALESQLRLLKQQNDITFKIAQNTDSASKLSRAQEMSKINIDGLNIELATMKASSASDIQRNKFHTQRKSIELEIARITSNSNRAAQIAALEAVKNAHKILHAEQELVDLRRSPGSTIGDDISKQRANIELQRKVLQDNFNNEKAAIMQKGSSAQKEVDALEKITAMRRSDLDLEISDRLNLQEKELEIFDAETANRKQKIQNDITAAANQKEIISLTASLDKNRINAAEANSKANFVAIEAQVAAMAVFQESVKGLNVGIEAFATSVAEILGITMKGTTEGEIARDKIKASVANLPNQLGDNLGATQAALAKQQKLQGSIFNEQRSSIEKIAKLNTDNADATIKHLNKVLGIAETNRILERVTLQTTATAQVQALINAKILLRLELEKARAQDAIGGTDRTLELLTLQAQLENDLTSLNSTIADLNYETNTWNQALNATKEVIGSSVTQALVDLNASFFDTANDVRTFGEKIQDSFANIFKSIQETFFEKTIAKPIGDFVMDAVSPIFGNLASEGIDNVVLRDGAVPVVMSSSDANGEDPVTALKDKAGGFFSTVFERIKGGFSSIFGEGGFLPNLANSVFGSDGLLAQGIRGLGNIGSTVFQGLGNILGSLTGGGGDSGGNLLGTIFKAGVGLFSGGTPAPAMAAGGIVKHMSQGGGVNGLRDRVPALLEPGEFVMRKQAAKSIGTPGLQAMNSGGGAGGNVVVNIKNEGTPQEATASAPKFDGEKFVIDIVTRDLANNGPIRRSMRAGA